MTFNNRIVWVGRDLEGHLVQPPAVSGSTPLCLINIYSLSLRAQHTWGGSSTKLCFLLDPMDSAWMLSAEPFDTPLAPAVGEREQSQPLPIPLVPTGTEEELCPLCHKLIAVLSLSLEWKLCQQGSSAASAERWRHCSESWVNSPCHAQAVWH